MNRTRQIEIFPTTPSTVIHSYATERNKGPCLIKPAYVSTGINQKELDPFVSYVEKILYGILPQDFLDALTSSRNQAAIKKKIFALDASLPSLHINYPKNTPCTLCVSVLCPAEFTNGVGRYLSDTFSHWLVPGRYLNTSCTQSLSFNFVAFPLRQFFFHQVFLDIYCKDDLMIIQNNWEALKNEIRLNILSVKHARQIIAVKKLSSEQKNALIQENISSVLNRPLRNSDQNAFDHMQHFLLQITAEDKLTQIKEQFLPSFQQRPKILQRDIFNELKHFILLFGEKFTALHEMRYVTRLIAYQYLFRKSLESAMVSAPTERHLSIKLLKTQLNFPLKNGNKTVLGIFGAMNVLRDNEIFEEKHLLQAIRHSLVNVRKVDNSFLLDRRSHDPIRIFYIEVEKKDGEPFQREEIKELQKNLPREIEESVESVIHPVFMPRNEEEIMRNIVLLSKQLKYASDLPQVIISFDTQVEQDLIFRVILLRILKHNAPPIIDFFTHSTELSLRDLEVKHAGLFRKRDVKEASVFRVAINKKKFLRKDFSIDLFKARQALSSELNKIFEGIRDFNGGILSKQQEAFIELRTLLKDFVTIKDFLLENFFYSLTPPLHQSLIKPSILKELFLLILEGLETHLKPHAFFVKAKNMEDQILIVIASTNPRVKEKLFSLIDTLDISAPDLSFAHVISSEIHCLGYIYQNRCTSKRTLFLTTISDYFHNKRN